jgi:hypothetical protein
LLESNLPDLDYRTKRYKISDLMKCVGVKENSPGYTVAMSRLLDVHPRTFEKMRKNGLSEYNADKYATKLGFHPGVVWPEWWPSEEEIEYLETKLKLGESKNV